MAISTENETTHRALNDVVRVHVADIEDNLTSENANSKYIEAAVQLVWPFSSTTSQLSLLLIENDVSLRDTTAQIRVTFHDTCAKEVARSKIGIGDVLRLDLKGASTEAEHEELSTPGKKAGYDLHFRDNVNLQAFTYDGQVKALNFVAPLPPVVLNGTHSFPKTPFRNGTIDISKTKLSSTTPKRIPRISLNSLSESLVDPFSEDDGYIPGHGRKRTKFARRSNQWRLENASDEESKSRADAIQDVPILDQAAAESGVDVAPVVAPQAIPSTDVHIIVEEGQPPQLIQTDGHDDAEHEATNLKVISVDEEESPTEVRKVELIIPDDQLPVSEEPVSASWEPQIPVERPTPEHTTTVPVQTPLLTALASPGLPLVSPLMFRTNGFSTHSQVTMNPDEGAPTLDEISTHDLPLETSESYDFAYVPEPTVQLQSATTDAVATSVDDIQPQHFMSVAITEEPEVDLDKLQEQIDMSNAEFIPDVLEQVIEDEDMYGPPRDREVGMDLQHIEEIRSRISTDEPEDLSLDPELVRSINRSPVSNDVWRELDGGDISPKIPTLESPPRDIPFETLIPDQIAFQPYPFHFETQTEIAEQVSNEVVNETEERGSISTVHESTMQLQFLDGVSASEAFNEKSAHANELSSASETDGVQTEHAPPEYETGRSPMGAVHIATPVDDIMKELSPTHAHGSVLNHSYTDEQHEEDEHESGPQQGQWAVRETFVESESNIPMDILTPEATQVTRTHAAEDLVNDNQKHVQIQLPPTPIESQVATSQQYAAEDQSFRHIDELVPDVADVTPARPVSGRALRDHDRDEGIPSPYFSSRAALLTPTSAIHSIKIPASSRMRLRSSSPADLPMDHLESERLAALEMPASQTSNVSQTQAELETQGGMVTPLEYYAHLNTLDEYYNQHVDVMAVCSADSGAPERAKSGPKDFFTTIHLVDRSVQEANTTITAQIFRPRKTAVPTIKRGDILLLRRFKVQTKSHKPMLLSTDESAWAVYQLSESPDTNGNQDARLTDTPIVSGPPVEYGPFESDNASRLLKWWLIDGSTHEFEGVADSLPAKLTETVGRQRPRKPAPAPIDLRRSPRKTRKTASIDVDHTPTSPVFEPESPAQSQMAIPSSQSHASPQSPASVRSTRSQLSPLKLQVKPVANAPVMSPLGKQPRFQHQSAPPSPNLEQPPTLTPGVPSTVPRNISSNDSVTSSVTKTSASSKRRRYERRSTSLVHKLRDGTEWVDIEQEEIFSVTESESESESDGDGDDSVSQQVETADYDHDQDEDKSPGDTMHAQSTPHTAPKPRPKPAKQVNTETPSKKPRGRPRKNSNRIPSPDPIQTVTADDPGASRQSRRRMTRTRSPQPEPELQAEPQAEAETIVVEGPSSPSSPVVEGVDVGMGVGRVTRSQAANSKGTG